MVASDVDCEISDAREEHHQQRRLGQEADQHLAPRAERAERVPMSIAASEMNTRASANRPDQRDGVGRQRERQVGRQRRDDRAGQRHAAEHDVRRGAKQRRRVLGHHRLLVEQLVQQVVRLQQRRRRLVLQPGAALVDPAGQQRRQRQREHDLEQLRDRTGPAERLDHCLHHHQQRDQRDEAEQQVHRDAALLQQADQPRHAEHAQRRSASTAQCPEVIFDDDR